MKRIYLDYAAAAPVSARAKHAFLRALPCFANPGSPHEEGRTARQILETARLRVARSLEVKSEYVVFTSGATEANALAIEGFVRACHKKGREARLIYHPGAHASVVRTIERLGEEGIEIAAVPLHEGEIDLRALASLLESTKETLISLEALSPETGARMPLRKVSELCATTGSYFHIDASQLPLVESIERTRLAGDLITLDAQKIGGVRGIGALVYSVRVPLLPIIEGGGQEGGLRSGTPSPALAAAFAEALEECAREREPFVARAKRARLEFISDLQEVLSGVVVNEGRENAPHILNLSFPGLDTDYLAALLNARGFAVSTKSACETDSTSGSRAVLALTGDAERAQATLRISWGRETKESDLRALAKAVIESVRFLQANPV